MSFDEQPDGDPHGECAAEIDKLTSENACMKWGLECAQRFVALWEQGEISAEGVLPQIKLDIERGLAGFAALSGAGTAKEVCPMCQGRGHTIESTYDHTGLIGQKPIPCPDCTASVATMTGAK